MASTSETGLELFARLTPRPSLVGIEPTLFPDGPNPKDVIELCGEVSCGKTLLFTQFMVKCILPKEFKNIVIGGLKVGVVLLNTDHHFQMFKLISMMEKYLQTTNTFNVADVEEIVKESMSRLVIYNIADSVQLQVTFHALQMLVSNRPDFGLILLDSVSAFYWQDTLMSKVWKIDLYVKNMTKNLQKVLSDFKGVIMYSRPAYFQSKTIKTDVSSSTSFSGLVNLKIMLRHISQENMFCADVETNTGRFSRTFRIDSSGIQWLQ